MTSQSRKKLQKQKKHPLKKHQQENYIETNHNAPQENYRKMNHNAYALLIGLVGVIITFSAYSQTLVSSTSCVTIGFLVLSFALLIREGFLSL